MQLDKRVCRICINEHRADTNTLGGLPRECFLWNDGDEYGWSHGLTVCCGSEMMADVTRPPPKWCRYSLEHVVSEKPC
jgi:hypothetical protein